MTEYSSKKLYRAGKDHVFGGVCAGIAEYLSIDVILLRIFWLILILVHGVGAIVYLVCLVLIPKNPEHEKLPPGEQKKTPNSGLYIGIAFVVIGLSFVFNRWFDFFWWDFDRYFYHFHWNIIWPVLLILFGVWYMIQSSKENSEQSKEKQKFIPEKLYRSRKQRMIGGVCGGLAEAWNIDVTLVRIGYVLVTIFTAIWLGVIAYVVMLVLVPEREAAPPVEKKAPSKRRSTIKKTKSQTEKPSGGEK